MLRRQGVAPMLTPEELSRRQRESAVFVGGDRVHRRPEHHYQQQQQQHRHETLSAKSEVEYLLQRRFLERQKAAAATAVALDTSDGGGGETSSLTVSMHSLNQEESMSESSTTMQHQRRKRNSNEDPMSHRIIEKRRRDRMNNCLADLSRLIPSSYLKKGRGRVEKTEIIEMATKHIRHLHLHSNCSSIEKCELTMSNGGSPSSSSKVTVNQSSTMDLDRVIESFRMGYHECLSEMMHFLVDKEGYYSADAFCVRLLGHLQRHFDRMNRVKSFRQPHNHLSTTTMTISSTSSNDRGSSGYQTANSTDGGGSQRSQPLSAPVVEESESSFKGADTQDYKDSIVLMAAHQSAERNLSMSSGAAMENADHQSEKRHPSSPADDDVNRDKDTEEKPENLSTHGLSSSKTEDGDAGGEKEEKDVHALYKFKANLQERFTHQHLSEDNRGGAELKPDTHGRPDDVTARAFAQMDESMRQSSEAIAAAVGTKRRRLESSPKSLSFNSDRDKEDTLELISLAASAIQREETKEKAARNPEHESCAEANVDRTLSRRSDVPIFALHPSGSFYLPLSVEYSTVAPTFRAFEVDTESSRTRAPVLHPVTINVNFCGPIETS